MSNKEELSELRQKIDKLDREMLELFKQRMRISEQVAAVKASANIALVDETRERQMIESAAAEAAPENKAETIAFMRTLLSISKLRQIKQFTPRDHAFFPPPSPPKDSGVTIAFQGVQGAWGEHAAVQLFPQAALQAYNYFEDVFNAVKEKEVDYGILPIENSQTGAIGEVYDLLRRHGCYIVGQTWITIAQCLLAGEGATLNSIREVYSHPEGFNQCRRFLKNKNWDLSPSTNTAYAAKMVAEKKDTRSAAIGSRRAAQIHGLSIIAPDIMDNPQNKTRFIAIAESPIYDKECTTTSITFSTPHKSGALCAILQTFMLAGINLSRLESRPVSADKYRFFADLQANIMDEATLGTLRQASVQCDYFEILGCYHTTQ